MSRTLKLGLSIRYLGYHLNAWRHPDVDPAGATKFEYFLESALAAERACFDMVFFADGVAIRDIDKPEGALCRGQQNVELEPRTLLAALAARTTHIGLVATASTTYNEPFHVARQYASIDHISGGRAGWNIVTSWSDEEARNFSREHHVDKALRYDRAKEFVEVVIGLWDSWEPDAFVHHKESGIFYNDAKRHALMHQGRHFRVDGPLNCSSTPQGRPVLFQAGDSEEGRAIAGKYADVVYCNAYTLENARQRYADLKHRAIAAGRAPGDLLVMPGLTPYIGASRQEAQEKYEQMAELTDWRVGLSMLYRDIGDQSGLPLDGPPQMRRNEPTSMGLRMIDLAREEGLSIRDLYVRIAAGNGVRTLIGTGADIADSMQEWLAGDAADGFNICPPYSPGGIHDFSRWVVPELRRRGLLRTKYEGRTLREHLGLRAHISRYARR